MSKEKNEKKEWRTEKRKTGYSIKTVKGKLYARIQYIDEVSGKRKEKSRPANNRTHARAVAEEMRKELERGGQTALEADKKTFRQVAEEYKEIKLIAPEFQNGIKIMGKRSYKHQISLLNPLIDHFGGLPIRSIKPGDLEAYKAARISTSVKIVHSVKKANPKKERRKFIKVKEIRERPRSIASVNRELSLLRQIFVYAEGEDYILRNPFVRAKKLISTAAEVQRERILSFDEENRLLIACRTKSRKHITPIVITALDTAMRKGELLKLKWKDIHLLTAIITVQATNTKTEKTRMIAMTSRVKSELEKLWEVSPKDKDILVFGIKDNFRRAWKASCEDAALSDLHFHDLRHTAITRFVRAGVPASEAMKISGHTEMKTFQRYVNLTNESVTASANLLDNFNAGQKQQIETDTASEMVN